LIAARRGITQARLQMGYVAQVRSRIARRLAAASWPIVSRLQHARVTNLLGADVQRVAGAANFLMQFLTSLVLTVFQMAIAFLLAPALTGIALVLIAVGVSASLLMVGRAHGWHATRDEHFPGGPLATLQAATS
jgi:ABC-type siderophore export system fused ATPase/permease subunit